MKIFSKQKAWPEKVNFVDDNNILLGYDLKSQCCEQANWFIAESPQNSMPELFEENPYQEESPDIDTDLEGWVFDTDFFQEVTDTSTDTGDDTTFAIFRIVKGDSEKFIHLFNCQNGYYGHGFSFEVGDEVIKEGVL